MIKGINFLIKRGVKNTVTLTGFKKNNSLNKKGRIKKAGKFLIYCDGEVFDVFEDGTEKLIASCTSIMAAVDIPVVQNPQK